MNPTHVGDSHEALTFHALPDTANPKDAAGRAKVPLHLWPASATAMGSVGLLEGELKYGRNNFRATPVAASVYVAACKRHLDAWMEGQETASDTGSPHLGNALACLAIIVDTQANGTLIDDRNYVPNPGAYDRLVAELTAQCAKLKEMFKDKSPKHWDARDPVSNPNIKWVPVGANPTVAIVDEVATLSGLAAEATHRWAESKDGYPMYKAAPDGVGALFLLRGSNEWVESAYTADELTTNDFAEVTL